MKKTLNIMRAELVRYIKTSSFVILLCLAVVLGFVSALLSLQSLIFISDDSDMVYGVLPDSTWNIIISVLDNEADQLADELADKSLIVQNERRQQAYNRIQSIEQSISIATYIRDNGIEVGVRQGYAEYQVINVYVRGLHFNSFGGQMGTLRYFVYSEAKNSTSSLQLAMVMFCALATMIAMSVLCQDFSTNSIKMIIVRPAPRHTVLTAKLLCMLVLTLIAWATFSLFQFVGFAFAGIDESWLISFGGGAFELPAIGVHLLFALDYLFAAIAWNTLVIFGFMLNKNRLLAILLPIAVMLVPTMFSAMFPNLMYFNIINNICVFQSLLVGSNDFIWYHPMLIMPLCIGILSLAMWRAYVAFAKYDFDKTAKTRNN